jgi:hypothetical protein
MSNRDLIGQMTIDRQQPAPGRNRKPRIESRELPTSVNTRIRSAHSPQRLDVRIDLLDRAQHFARYGSNVRLFDEPMEWTAHIRKGEQHASFHATSHQRTLR